MIEMETMDLYEGSGELSLFGREQLLLELGSPLEPDVSSLFPHDGEETTAAGLLVKETPSLLKRELVTSNVVQPHPLPLNISEQASCLDMSWLDTKLDLYDLIGDDGATQFTFVDPSEACNMDPAPVPAPPTTDASEPTAEDLLNQISLGLTLPETTTASTPVVTIDNAPMDNCTSLLSDVFNKLSSDIELMVRQDNMNLPDLGQSVLSPVSVDDIESLLSGPVSPESSSYSPMDSGLESLLSTQPNSPQAIVPNEADYDGDYVPPAKAKSRKRTTPYSKTSPKDKKERKKVQNKTAALKYRQKKKGESQSLDEQCSELETKNKSLKDKVDSMTREIQYLKDLMSEVVKAKTVKR